MSFIYAQIASSIHSLAHYSLKQVRLISGNAGRLPFGWTRETLEQANKWTTTFKARRSIDKQDVDVSFARSSGPGGQHVNKTNTKAVVKLSLNSPMLPPWIKEQLRKSPYYVASASALQTASTTSRSQADNLSECLRKIHTIILDAAERSIPVLPSDAQQKKVLELQRKERMKRKEDKMRRKGVKEGRRAKWDD